MELTKEDIDKIRHIEGFPNGTDEKIISLSKPESYTACPNPFIEKFIKKHGTPYDEETDDYKREPFASDVSEDKHGLIYNIHGYHTKVPPSAIVKFIEHYTKPGDLIFDGFCGSGMTGVAAQMCHKKNVDTYDNSRKAILCDLSPYATFISSNYNQPNDGDIIYDLKQIIDKVKAKYGEYFLTNHVNNKGDTIGSAELLQKGIINYTVWSNVYYCPNCSHEIVYYDATVNKENNSVSKKFNCENCNLELEKNKLILKFKTEYDYDLKIDAKTVVKVPVLINYTYNKKRYTKVPDKKDLLNIEELKKSEKSYIPLDLIPKGDETNRLMREGVTHVKQLYADRTLFFISLFYEEFKNDNKKIFLLTSALAKLTILNRFMPQHGSRALVGPRTGTYYLPPICVENNVINQLQFQLGKLKNLKYSKGEVIVSTQSSTDLTNIPSNSIDYVFIDPPFGANIMYSELSYVAESWLGVHSKNDNEAIVNKSQGKDLYEYKKLIDDCFIEINRVLKPNRWMTLEFHNSKNSIWNGIQESLGKAGFIISDVRILDKKKKTINQSTAYGSVDKDLIISAYKPKESFKKRMLENSGSEETAWEFVREYLSKLPITIVKSGNIQVAEERQAELLFDRMIAYHIMTGIAVPMNAGEFYKGLDERFLERDGMYFLHDQINEYDNIRIVSELEPIQFSLFVNDEKTAIAWLYHQLEEPQSYSDLLPKFMQEANPVKHEKLPELGDLLEEGFLKNEKGEWYIPDPKKAVDIIKLREKRLIKEFSEYLVGKSKLKLFRTEAIRVGFAKLYKDKDYENIVKVADRLPEKVIQEDDKLLMYYDIALSRME